MNLVDRAKNILLTPKTEWEAIKGENLTVADMFTQYAMILAAIPAAAGFIGFSVVGISFGFGTFRYPLVRGLFWAIIMYVISLVGVYALGFIMDTLAPNFGAKKDLAASMKVAVFAYTASWIAGIFSIIPSLAMLSWIGGLYSLYLMYLGIQALKEAPADKLMGYFIVTLVVTAVIIWLGSFIAGMIAFPSMASAANFHY
jgi:hypothetical protein